MIVGAPTDDTSHLQRDVNRGGAVYKCDIRENDRCIMIPFDRESKRRSLSIFLPPTQAITTSIFMTNLTHLSILSPRSPLTVSNIELETVDQLIRRIIC